MLCLARIHDQACSRDVLKIHGLVEMPSLFQKSWVYFGFQMETFPLGKYGNENWKLGGASHIWLTLPPPQSLHLKNNYNEIEKLSKDFVSVNAAAVMPCLFWGMLSIKLRLPEA